MLKKYLLRRIMMTSIQQNDDIKDEIRKNNPHTRFPSKLNIRKNGNTVIIELYEAEIKNENMQVPQNSFEGWAVAVRSCSNGYKVVLDVNGLGNYSKSDYLKKGHLSRFLYRAQKFKEQYGWFELSTNLKAEVNKFKEYLDSNVFVNNFPQKEADNTERIDDENAFEEELSKPDILREVLGNTGIVGDCVYRQLPVGLFEEKKVDEKAVFTHRKSAIDLWTIKGDTITIIELKTKNRMIGIITEIFFYSNYIYDFLKFNNFEFNHDFSKIKTVENLRGYDKLYENKEILKCVRGIMLADDNNFHPCVKNREITLKILNDSANPNIKYDMASYSYNIAITPSKQK